MRMAMDIIITMRRYEGGPEPSLACHQGIWNPSKRMVEDGRGLQ